MQVREAQIGVHEGDDDLEVRFDPSHLHQVVWNLCDNAMKYGEAREGISFDMKLGRLNPRNRPFLEVSNWRTRDRASGSGPNFRAFLYGPKRRHGTWAIHRARIVSAQPRYFAVRSHAAVMAASSGSCSAIHNAGRVEFTEPQAGR